MKASRFSDLIRMAAIFGVALVPAGSAFATHQECGCEQTVCSTQGFEITFVDFEQDSLNGVNRFTYKVCNDESLTGVCTPPKDLSHIDIVLPEIGECVSPTQQIGIQQLGCPGCNPELDCSVNEKDPSCDLCAPGTGVPGTPCEPPSSPSLKVLKCNVKEGQDLDPGECVNIQVTIAGEVPGLGPGTVDAVTKAGPECESNAICGPACNCPETSTAPCLTRTAGFWGTHPSITELFLPITVCGKTLDTTDVAPEPVCSSVTEALCVSPGLEGNRKMDRKPAREQLARQLAAAKLNLAANGGPGSCGDEINARIAACEELCNRTQKVISSSGCLADLDAFNNSGDSVDETPPPFDSPGPAEPKKCQDANGNGVIILSCP